jgi:DNA-binding transcriptional MocR family regulator
MKETLPLEVGIPKYIQIGNWLKEMIQKGRYAVRDKLPSESKLSELFRVNRNTVRQAISNLVAEGLVVARDAVEHIHIPQAGEARHHEPDGVAPLRDEAAGAEVRLVSQLGGEFQDALALVPGNPRLVGEHARHGRTRCVRQPRDVLQFDMHGVGIPDAPTRNCKGLQFVNPKCA